MPPGLIGSQHDVAATGSLSDDWVALKVDLIESPAGVKYARSLGVSRTVLVPRSFTLDDLAMCLCVEFDRWETQHLYSFQLPRERYERLTAGPSWDDDVAPTDVTLSELDLRPGDRIEHIFDLGACWRHRILVRPWTAAAERELLAEATHALAVSGSSTPAGDDERLAEALCYVSYQQSGESIPQYPPHDD